jgi:hypothetical protein
VEVIDFPSVGNGNDVATVGVRSNGELVMWRNWNMDARWTSDRRMFSAAPHVLGNSFVKLYRIDPKWGDAHVRLFAQKGDGSIWELVNSSETQGKYVPTMKKVFGI